MTEPTSAGPRVPGRSGLTAVELRPLTIPILISAAANLIGGYFWLIFTACFGIFLTAPMLVLCAFEFIYFARAPHMTPQALTRRAGALGGFEILLGMFNGVSFVCGIVVLINLAKVKQRLSV